MPPARPTTANHPNAGNSQAARGMADAGTITGGLKKLVPLFQPLYELLVEHTRAAEHWHCDETRWRVFVLHAGKAGFVWYLWVFVSKEPIVFVLDPTRAHDVPEAHFGD